MLHTQNLAFAYSSRSDTFNFPDISVKAGETMLVLGESGKGKTTFLHLLGGILTPKSGEVWIGNTNMAGLRGAKLDHFRGSRIGIMFQRPHFLPSLTVMENLCLAPWLANLPQKDIQIREMALKLGIGSLLNKKSYALSQGEQQRATLARAVINHPALILADEPTSALDDRHCETVADLLKEVTSVTNAALVVVTHDNRLKSRFPHQLTLE